MCGSFRGPNKVKVMIAMGAVPAESWNDEWDTNDAVAPTELSPLITHDGIGRRTAHLGWWGWRPPWMKTGVLRLARSEEAATKPSFAVAWSARRCIVPAAGVYEWLHRDGHPSAPWLASVRGAEMFGMAGLFDDLGDQRRFVMVTVPSNDLVMPLNDRMPAILRPEDYDRWLARGTPAGDLAGLCRTFPSAQMDLRESPPLRPPPPDDGQQTLQF